MTSIFRKSILTLATLASLVGGALTTPAAAWDDWGGHGRGWYDGRRDRDYRDYRDRDRRDWGRGDRDRHGWGFGGWDDRERGWDRPWRHRWHRERCWTVTREVEVYTPWGPRRREVEQRVCR
jgi:hypothetical protein